MEEKLVLPDFDEWLANYKPPVLTYNAAFEVDTGRVISVGPDYVVNKNTHANLIPIPSDVAEDIISGNIRMSKCFVDPAMGELEIVEVMDLFKIDDVLHRIIEKKWSEVEKPEVYLSYDSSKSLLTIKLTEELGGTYKLDAKFHPITKRKIFWDGETVMQFLVTDYNDPHIIHQTVELKISELTEKTKAFNIECPSKFSIYTRRLFKNYVIEVI